MPRLNTGTNLGYNAPRLPGQAKPPRASCSVCGVEFYVRAEGTISMHEAPEGTRCPGAALPPAARA